MQNLKNAREILDKFHYSLVVTNGNEVYFNTARGVKPLLNLIEKNIDFSTFSAADNVIGKGAAFLYLKLNIKKIYTKIISLPALNLLKEHGCFVVYDSLVENILNRKKDDFCPMEKLTLSINDIEEAYAAIKEKYNEISKCNN